MSWKLPAREDISSDELEEINITLENVSEGDFDI